MNLVVFKVVLGAALTPVVLYVGWTFTSLCRESRWPRNCGHRRAEEREQRWYLEI